MQASPIYLPIPFPLFATILFTTAWALICLLTSVWSRWHSLSRRFRAQSEPYGETRTAGPLLLTVYTRFLGHYSGSVRLTASEDALYLAVLFLIRVGHPPLCIPWNEIKLSRTKRFWRRYVVLTLGEQEQIPMRIPERMARKLGILNRIPEGANSLPDSTSTL